MSAGPGKDPKGHILSHSKNATFLRGLFAGLVLPLVIFFAAGIIIKVFGDPSSPYFTLFRAMIACLAIAVVLGSIARSIFLGRRCKKNPAPYQAWATRNYGEAAGVASSLVILIGVALLIQFSSK
jgi:hypothetical protein